MADLLDKPRGQTSHKPPEPVKNATKPIIRYNTDTLRRLFDWLVPYSHRNFPGKYHQLVSLAPGYSLSALRLWLHGSRRPPPTMLRYWLEVLTGQEERIADLKRELVDEIARLENRPKRVPHFEAVRRKRLERPREP